MTEFWRCNKCGKEFDKPVYKKLKVTLESVDNSITLLEYDMCLQDHENTTVPTKKYEILEDINEINLIRKWWLDAVIEAIKETLPRPLKI